MTLEEAIAALAALQKKFDAAQAELDKSRTDAKAIADGKVAELQKTLDQAAAARDAAQAEVKKLQDAAKAGPSVDALVAQKMDVVDGARILHGDPKKVDSSKGIREIMVEALKSRDPEFKDLKTDGKPESDDYVRARFDLAVEQQKKADASLSGSNADSALGGTARFGVEFLTDDAERSVRQYDAAVFGHRAYQSNAWKGADVATKERERVTKAVSDRGRGRLDGNDRRLGAGLEYDGSEIYTHGVNWVRQQMPRQTLDQFARLEGLRKDSDPATAFFQRQLMHIMVKPYEFIYPEIAYSTLFPITYEVPTGARTYAFHQYDDLGAADIVDDYADDAPNADVVGREMIGRVFPVRSEFMYSIQDIRSAMMASIPLEAMKAVRARRIIERKCDILACTGSLRGAATFTAGTSIAGVANDPNIAAVTPGTKANGGTTWIASGAVNATPNEILKDINLGYQTILNNTAGAIEADTIVFGKNAWGLTNTLRLDNFNNMTIGAYIRGTLPWVKAVLYWPRLNTAGSGGVERVLICKRSEEFFRFVIPQEFEMFPAQPINLAFKTPCHKRWAEPQMIQPKAHCYLDNTSS